MSKSFMNKIIFTTSILFLVIILNGCGMVYVKSTSQEKTLKEKNIIKIRFMSNLTNRSTGQGKIEQLLADRYTKEHPNVKIIFETFQDDAFQQKFKAYVSLNDIPDIYMTWTGSQFDLPAKVSAELNPKDFKDYGFISGALETRMRNGKLYGIPKNNDMYFLYYNRDIFESNNIKIPNTFQELLTAAKKLRSKDIIPCATNGKDKWELSGIFTDIYYKVNPSPKMFHLNWDNASFEGDPFALKAARYYKQLIDANFFQDSYMTTDYGTAKNLFTSGKAAMYYMGSWELSMTSDEDLSDGFRKNLAVMQIPPIDGEKNDVSVLSNWYGGGYSVNKNSKVKKEAIEFLKYFFKPENWAQLSWDNGVCIAPQSFKLNANEMVLLKSVFSIFEKTDIYQGNYPTKRNGGSFGTGWWDTIKELTMGVLTPEEFLKAMDKGLKQGFKEDAYESEENLVKKD